MPEYVSNNKIYCYRACLVGRLSCGRCDSLFSINRVSLCVMRIIGGRFCLKRLAHSAMRVLLSRNWRFSTSISEISHHLGSLLFVPVVTSSPKSLAGIVVFLLGWAIN